MDEEWLKEFDAPDVAALDFVGPSEVDSASGIPDEGVNLLNQATNGSDLNPWQNSAGHSFLPRNSMVRCWVPLKLL